MTGSSSAPVRFGLIGYGAWGGHHAQAIAETDGAALVAIAAHSQSSLARARDDFPGASVTDDYRELLSGDDLEAVDIVLPTHLHREAGVTALQAGKHVLLEKPMAATMEDCLALHAAAESSGRVVAIGHEFRLSSQWGAVHDIVRRGEIGTPQYVLVELSRQPYRLGSDGWRYDPTRVGNWVLEEPIHFFDLARWYLGGHGEPATVYAAANSRDPSRPSLHDNFSAIVRWTGGAYAVVSQTLAAFEHHQCVKVVGTDGAVWAGWSGALDRTERPDYFVRVMRGLGSEVEPLELEAPSGELFELRWEIERMVDAIRNGTPPHATSHDGLWSAGLCLASIESVQSGQPVDLSRFLGL